MSQLAPNSHESWHTDQDCNLPVGSPMMMMGFTKDGQLDEAFLKHRDQRINISTADKNKTDAADPAVDWQQMTGKKDVRQFKISTNIDSARHKH